MVRCYMLIDRLMLCRHHGQSLGREWLEKKFLPWFGPVALLALIYTVLVLFGLQVGAQLLSVSATLKRLCSGLFHCPMCFANCVAASGCCHQLTSSVLSSSLQLLTALWP